MKSKNITKNQKGQIQSKVGKNNSNQKQIINLNSKKQKNSSPYGKNNSQINNSSSKNNRKSPTERNVKVLNKNNNIIKKESKSVKKINKINNMSPPKQIKKLKDYQFMEFHPYTLKDYKELVRNPVVMGPLGPNIGTKEWEEKKNKMKKMMNYSNNINKEHKGIKTLKKDTPKEEIEKLTKEKNEKSIRHRTFEYGKFIRTGKYKEEFDVNDYINDNQNNLNVIQENQNDEIIVNYNEENNNNSKNFEQENNMNNNNENLKEDEYSYGQLIKQNEEYESKIKDIRDHILD